jgi:hypothetical protein
VTLTHADSLSAPEEQQIQRPEQMTFRPDIESLRAVEYSRSLAPAIATLADRALAHG